MKNIVLVGFMGAGKTSVGKRLAAVLGASLVNTDEQIERKECTSINDIFSKKGEPYFRMLERDVVKEISKKKDIVIDAGGGVMIDAANVADLKENGIIFCLAAAPDEILKRTRKHTDRPLLNVADPLAEIKKLLEKRAEYYKRADYQIETTGKTIDEIAEEILRIYNKAAK